MLDIIFSWNTLWWITLLLYVPCCFGLIIIVLLQKGKGVGFQGAFGMGGAGGGDTLFGPTTARSLPQKLTYLMAGIFMGMALIMSTLSGKVSRGAAPELEEIDEASATMEAFFDEQEDGAGTDAAAETEAVTPEVTEIPEITVESEVAEEEAPETMPDLPEPTEEAPAEEAAEEAPAEEAPAETAAEEAPAEEATAETAQEAPAEEATAETAQEAPAEEATAETAEEAPAEEAGQATQ